MDESLLLSIPPEVRMVIYEYLFVDAGNTRLQISNARGSQIPDKQRTVRTRYYVLERSFHRRCYETTYRLETAGVGFCSPLMRVCRIIHEETSYLVYGKHTFDFGSDIEAVQPFFSDLTAPTRDLVHEISLYKRGPFQFFDNDKTEWRNLCRFLQSNNTVRKLRLTVQAGMPSQPWEGPDEFSVSDFKLLAHIKHESLEWISELSQVKGIRELEVLPDVHYCPPPSSTSMIVFAALSASIEKGLTEFLRLQLCLKS